MTEALQFETPENVRVQYLPAGLGTRFVAWFVDQFFVAILLFVVLIVLAIVSTSVLKVLDQLEAYRDDPERLAQIFLGVLIVVMSLGSFVYYTLSELLWRGQTIGKRLFKIRVVKSDGFALDPASILLRNIFRVVDHIPLLWVVPVMSKRSQRTGDMVGGTLVVSDETPNLTPVRVQLSERKVVEAEFRFDSRSLGRLTERDFEAVERLLDRWDVLPSVQRDDLVSKLIGSLTAKMNFESPAEDRRQRFLEDLLAAELRRQSRLLA